MLGEPDFGTDFQFFFQLVSLTQDLSRSLPLLLGAQRRARLNYFIFEVIKNVIFRNTIFFQLAIVLPIVLSIDCGVDY